MKNIVTLILALLPLVGFAQTNSDSVKNESIQPVETVPEYPGGQEAMNKFIAKHLKYPKAARKKGIEGRVVIEFVVDTDGSIIDAKIVKDIGEGCGQAALDVVNKMPKWQPGMQRGKNVKTRLNLPFSFKLE